MCTLCQKVVCAVQCRYMLRTVPVPLASGTYVWLYVTQRRHLPREYELSCVCVQWQCNVPLPQDSGLKCMTLNASQAMSAERTLVACSLLLSHMEHTTVIPRLTSDSANEFFG